MSYFEILTKLGEVIKLFIFSILIICIFPACRNLRLVSIWSSYVHVD